MKLVVFLFLSSLCTAQVINGIALQRITSSNYVRALPTANVSTCLLSDNALPCTHLVTTYTDSTLSVACVTLGTPVSGPNCSNPGLADTDGNYTIFAPAGLYTVCVSSGTSLNCYKASTGGGTGCSSGCVLLAPTTDQTITGAHAVILSDPITNPNFGVQLDIDPTGTFAPIEVHSGFANGATFYTHSAQSFRASAINLFTSRGTRAIPGAATGAISYFNFGGYDTSTYFTGAQIEVSTGITWSPTNHSNSLDISTTAAGQINPAIVFRFGSTSDNGGDINANVSKINLSMGGNVFGFSPGADANLDTSLSRDSAGVIDVGNGTQGNASGTMRMAVVQLSANISWTSGAGVPAAGTCVAANGGSLYSRTDGTPTTTLYVCDNSTHTWTPK